MKKIKHKVDKRPHHKTVGEFDAERFFSRYQKLIMGIVVTVVLVIIFVTAVLLWFRSQEREANTALARVVRSEDLDKIIKRFPHTRIKPVAMIELAADLYQKGDYTRAKIVYQQFLKQYPRHPLFPAAQLGEAYCYESLEDYIKAEPFFVEIVQKYPQTIWGEEASTRGGRFR